MPAGILFFVLALLLSIFTPLFLRCYSVALSYFIIPVLIRECLGKHSYTSFSFSIVILNGNCFFFREVKSSLFWPKLRLSKFNQTKLNLLHFIFHGHIFNEQKCFVH